MKNLGKGFRLYKTAGDRRRAATQLSKRYNYLVGFRNADAEHPAGLSFGNADWVPEGAIHAKDVFYQGNHIVH